MYLNFRKYSVHFIVLLQGGSTAPGRSKLKMVNEPKIIDKVGHCIMKILSN